MLFITMKSRVINDWFLAICDCARELLSIRTLLLKISIYTNL